MQNNKNAPRAAGSGTRETRYNRLKLGDIIPHLERVKQVGEREYLAACPLGTHGKGRGDVNPSLSLTETPDGELLVKCHAGCDSREVLQELRRLAGKERAARSAQRSGLTVSEYARAKRLDMNLLKAWHVSDALYDGKPVVKIEYRAVDGALLATQYRLALEKGDSDCRFRWRRGDSAQVYGLWRVPEFDSREVWCVEGVSDAHTCWSAGVQALALPSASGKRLAPIFWQHAERFERVYLCFDSDSAGAGLLQAMVDACPEALQERVRIVQLPAGVKDVSDVWIHLDGDAARFRERLAQLERVSFLECSNALKIHEFEKPFEKRDSETERESDAPLLVNLGEWLDSYGDLQLEWIPLLGVDGILARGTATLIASHPKSGKSTLLVHACREWLQRGLRVVYLTEEPPIVWKLRIQRFPELRGLMVSAIARAHPENWCKAILAIEPDVVIVDTIRRFGGIVDENDPAKVGYALRYFTDLTRDLPRTAVVVVHHTRKGVRARGDASVDDVAGAHAFTGEVDSILTLLVNDRHERQRLIKPVDGRLWLTAPEAIVAELSEDGREYRIVGTAETILPEQEREHAEQAVLDALHTLGEATVREIAEQLTSQGAKRSERWIQKVLSEYERSGTVARDGAGTRNAPYVYRLTQSASNSIQPDSRIVSRTEFDACSRNADSGANLSSESDGVSRTVSRTRESLYTFEHSRNGLDADDSIQPDSRIDSRILSTFEHSSIRETDAPSTESEQVFGTGCSECSDSAESDALSGSALVDALCEVFDGAFELSGRAKLEYRLQQLMDAPAFPVEAEEAEQARVLWRLAESLNFPSLVIPEYATIEQGESAWSEFLWRAAGTPACVLALEQLQQRRLLRNGSHALRSPQEGLS